MEKNSNPESRSIDPDIKAKVDSSKRSEQVTPYDPFSDKQINRRVPTKRFMWPVLIFFGALIIYGIFRLGWWSS